MHYKKLVFLIGMTLTIFTGITFQAPETLRVFSQSENLTLLDAQVKKMPNSNLNANLTSNNEIPQDGSKGAMGIAIISDKGFDSIVASTTHGGVADSERQKNASDPIWHNHFVKLSVNNSTDSKCGTNPQVQDITFQSPGNVTIDNMNMQLSDISHSFNATHSLNNNSLIFEQGNVIDKAVTFKLEPKHDSSGDPEAICVTNIQPALNMSIVP